jgi:hypothetical protein
LPSPFSARELAGVGEQRLSEMVEQQHKLKTCPAVKRPRAIENTVRKTRSKLQTAATEARKTWLLLTHAATRKTHQQTEHSRSMPGTRSGTNHKDNPLLIRDKNSQILWENRESSRENGNKKRQHFNRNRTIFSYKGYRTYSLI